MFMELIQTHERSWGMEQYPGRPSLAELLHRPVVVFWLNADKSGKGRYTVTVHDQIDELNSLLLDLILASKVILAPTRRLSHIYVKQKAFKITSIQLVLAEAGKSER